MIKNFALLGVATGPDGMVYVTDNDVIETSNLSRQFLFRATDVQVCELYWASWVSLNPGFQKPKSECAAAAIRIMNPAIKVDARLDRVGNDSEDIYTVRALPRVLLGVDSSVPRTNSSSPSICALMPSITWRLAYTWTLVASRLEHECVCVCFVCERK